MVNKNNNYSTATKTASLLTSDTATNHDKSVTSKHDKHLTNTILYHLFRHQGVELRHSLRRHRERGVALEVRPIRRAHHLLPKDVVAFALTNKHKHGESISQSKLGRVVDANGHKRLGVCLTT